MKTAVLLSYKGLGTNLLHLAYCHEIAKRFGPITIITICKNLEQALIEDPLINEVIYLDKYYKKFFDIFSLSKLLKKINISNLFIYYPSLRYLLASKIAGIKNIYYYPVFTKKNLHLVKAAKEFTEQTLKIKNCPTETELFINQKRKEENIKKIDKTKKNIILGVGSSGPTTRWGANNFINLIEKLNINDNYFFYLLCGPEEKEIANKIFNKIGETSCKSLSNKNIFEIIPLISVCDMYVGNDSFGHHITSQKSIPSIIIMLDTPKAYSDYSKNQFRILPKDAVENKISHDSTFDPNSVSVDMVLKKISILLK